MREISTFLGRVIEACPAIRSIWLIGEHASVDVSGLAASAAWDLVAFADAFTLQRLRKAADLHRADIHLRVVTDGDRFESAWGGLESSGSLMQWGWRHATPTEAYYNEAKWAGPVQDGNVERTRRRALRLWQSAEPTPGRRRNLVSA